FSTGISATHFKPIQPLKLKRQKRALRTNLTIKCKYAIFYSNGRYCVKNRNHVGHFPICRHIIVEPINRAKIIISVRYYGCD
ncbi:MAG: hypothetical protein PVI62_06030, partial [Desulfobacterales bacterium]